MQCVSKGQWTNDKFILCCVGSVRYTVTTLGSNEQWRLQSFFYSAYNVVKVTNGNNSKFHSQQNLLLKWPKLVMVWKTGSVDFVWKIYGENATFSIKFE